jgi:hypothetical protein
MILLKRVNFDSITKSMKAMWSRAVNVSFPSNVPLAFLLFLHPVL